MKLPKVEFVYSSVYDDMRRTNPSFIKKLNKIKDRYPSQKEVLSYKRAIEKEWKKRGKKILREMSKIMNLPWKEDKIKCYIIGRGRSFSDPLTVRIYKDKSKFIDTLTHELIHQLQIQNSERMKKWWKYVAKKYKDEAQLTRRHIFLHAVHSQLYKRIFKEKRLKRDIEESKQSLDYKKAWDIVEKEVDTTIIKRFKKIVFGNK